LQPVKTTPAEAPTTLFMKSLRFGIISPLPEVAQPLLAMLLEPGGSLSAHSPHVDNKFVRPPSLSV
jgi:hypothetical protein